MASCQPGSRKRKQPVVGKDLLLGHLPWWPILTYICKKGGSLSQASQPVCSRFLARLEQFRFLAFVGLLFTKAIQIGGSVSGVLPNFIEALFVLCFMFYATWSDCQKPQSHWTSAAEFLNLAMLQGIPGRIWHHCLLGSCCHFATETSHGFDKAVRMILLQGLCCYWYMVIHCKILPFWRTIWEGAKALSFPAFP